MLFSFPPFLVGNQNATHILLIVFFLFVFSLFFFFFFCFVYVESKMGNHTLFINPKNLFRFYCKIQLSISSFRF